mmetsp:Transcript_50180/g.112979  ORF Transcript_50180/g.112979 Transcript_50180/m.112979 type:complete len:346 (+) Transcript_50180:75-1112(+)
MLVPLLFAALPCAASAVHHLRQTSRHPDCNYMFSGVESAYDHNRTTADCSALEDADRSKVIVDNYLDGSYPVVLFGWTMCSCVAIAQERFADNGLCVEQRLWSGPEPLLKYLQCLADDSTSHSFIYFKQEDGSMKLVGNGFKFDKQEMPDSVLQDLISTANAETECGSEAVQRVNVYGTALDECRIGDDSRGSWQDDGTCTEAAGYVHQICLESIPADFSTETGQQNWSEGRNGARHCVCIGAWSLYMTKEETNPVMPHCRAIPATALSPTYIANWKKWYVSGQAYPSDVKVGIGKLVEKCLQDDEALNISNSEKCGLKSKFEALQQREPELSDVEVPGLAALSC